MHKITVYSDSNAFFEGAARRMVEQIKAVPTSVVGLSTGRTTGPIHAAFVRMVLEEGVDCSRATFVGVDEVINVDREYAGACYRMLRTELLDPLHLPDEQFLILPTRSADWKKTCAAFDERLHEAGGIDVLELGLGENGHLGFNQPGTPFESRVRISCMTAELEARIRRETQTPNDVQLGGATLGMRNIMHARHILLVANGSRKADIVRLMLEGPVTTDIPASILQLHPACEFILEEKAAQKLKYE